MCVNSEGSGGTARMRRLAWAFAGSLCDKYHISWAGSNELDWNIKSEMRSFKSNENIHKKEGWSYYVVSANKASSVTL